MTLGNAIFQGIIQGLTEFLPISSSGHLSLVQYFTGQNGESGVLFSLLLHLGTLIAVCIAFHRTIWDLIREFCIMVIDLFHGKFSLRNPSPKRRMIFLLIVSLLPMSLTMLFMKQISRVSTDDDIIVEGICFLITSLLLFLSVKCVKGRKNARTATYKDVLAVGLAQAVAPLPGVSRSGSTISVGLMMGLDRKFVVAFSFIMGIPTILAANVMEIGAAVQEGVSVSIPLALVGILTAMFFGLLAIKMVNWLVASDKFTYFAWYTLVLGILTVVLGIIEAAAGHPIQKAVMAVLASGVL